MDPLDFKTNEELLFFFHRKKTEISCIDQPHRLLTQLRDHDLLPEKLFENVKNMRSREQKEKGFYEVLDWVEKNRCQDIHQFWRCVFEDHILQLYPTLRKLKNSLLDGTFNLYEKPPDVETLTEEEKSEGKAKKGEEKSYTRKRSKDDSSSEDSDDPDLFSAFTPSQKKPDKTPPFTSPVKKGDKQEIWKCPIYKTQLPVTCGDKEGTLYWDKLAEGEKCILSQGCWFTPTGFEKFGGKERCKNWKTSIRCRNITLKKLIEEGHLQCPQRKSGKKTCVQKNMNERFPVSSNMSSSKECYVCRSEGDLVCCDECLQAFHSHCHLPAVHGDSPGEWICSFCMLRNSQQWCDPSNMSEQKAFNAPVSQYIWHCHCFLLCAYREDTQKVFVKDPRQKVSRYSEFISQPMWLDRIKQKLESGEYQTVRAFVSDFQLIFRNCSMFNRDNEFGRMGARLKQILEEEFQKIFSIQ